MLYWPDKIYLLEYYYAEAGGGGESAWNSRESDEEAPAK
jgi:hypothetical protein